MLLVKCDHADPLTHPLLEEPCIISIDAATHRFYTRTDGQLDSFLLVKFM